MFRQPVGELDMFKMPLCYLKTTDSLRKCNFCVRRLFPRVTFELGRDIVSKLAPALAHGETAELSRSPPAFISS